MQSPPVPPGPDVTKMRAVPPAFLSDKATLTFSSTRDSAGERVLLVSWHQDVDTRGNGWTGQMELTELDVERLRDFCAAWLALVPPPEPREAA